MTVSLLTYKNNKQNKGTLDLNGSSLVPVSLPAFVNETVLMVI